MPDITVTDTSVTDVGIIYDAASKHFIVWRLCLKGFSPVIYNLHVERRND